MQLQLSTWQEVEAYLERSTTVIVPIGSTEQHGPNGLIGTDAICPEVVAKAVGEAEDALVGPTISVGMAQHHLAFPGSITLRPSTLIACVSDYVDSLARHGFDGFYFLNGHGGNIATLGAAFSEIYARRSLGETAAGLRLALTNWWDGGGVRQLSRELFPGIEGSHATPSEVSLSYFAHPHAVKSGATFEPRVAPSGRFRDAEDYRRRFPDGRIGSDPSGASPEAGERLFHAAVDDVRRDFRAFADAGGGAGGGA